MRLGAQQVHRGAADDHDVPSNFTRLAKRTAFELSSGYDLYRDSVGWYEAKDIPLPVGVNRASDQYPEPGWS